MGGHSSGAERCRPAQDIVAVDPSNRAALHPSLGRHIDDGASIVEEPREGKARARRVKQGLAPKPALSQYDLRSDSLSKR